MEQSQRAVYKLMILGDGGVGKSAITLQLVHNYFEACWDPTIEDSYEKDVVIDGRPCLLDILDTSGQDEYMAMRDANMRQRDGFLLVCGVDDSRTVDTLATMRMRLLRVKEETDECTPIVLVANKCDLLQQAAASSHVLGRCEQLARQWHVPFVQTSAKTRSGVDTAFECLVRRMRHAGYGAESRRGAHGAHTSTRQACPCCTLL